MRPHRRQPTRLPIPGFSRQEHWSGLPFPSPMHESEREVAQSCLTLATPWTAAYQAPPSMGFSRQKYWSGVPSCLKQGPCTWEMELSDYLVLFSFVVAVQFLSHVWLWDTMDYSTPGFPIPHYLLEFAQTHVHWAGDVNLSYPLLPLSPFAFHLSQHQSLF